MPDWQKLLTEHGPKLALGIMAAKSGGPRAVSAFLEGVYEAQARQMQGQRQQQADTRASEMHAAQLKNLGDDNTRQQQDSEWRRFQEALKLIEGTKQQQAEFATDPVQAENAVMQQASSVASAAGLPPDKLTGLVPNMTPHIQKGVRADVAALLDRAATESKRQSQPFDDTTISLLWEKLSPRLQNALVSIGHPEGQPVKPSTLNQLQGISVTPGPKVKQTPATPGSFEEYVDAPPGRQSAIEAARKRYMQSDDRPLASQQPGASGLPPRTQARVNRLADMFRQDPAVKRANVVAEGYSFAKSLSDTSQSPSDDQALIYAFAKAMDPDSVVREGEYATVQKYAQSWMDNFKFNAQRVLSNQEFLTPQARKNMKATIKQKYLASKGQYDNVRKQSAAQINKITGGQGGEDYLIDYGEAFPEDAPATSPSSGGVPSYQEYLQRRQGGAQ